MHEVAISAMWWCNRTDCHRGPWRKVNTNSFRLFGTKTHSVDTTRWALDRPLWHFMIRRIFREDSQRNAQMLHTQGRAIAVNLELTWQHPLSEFCPKLTKATRVNWVDLSPWQSIWLHHHVVLIATSRASLITSFQPPLGMWMLKVVEERRWQRPGNGEISIEGVQEFKLVNIRCKDFRGEQEHIRTGG